MIGPEAFCRVLADYFRLDAQNLTPATRLELEAGFDSLMLLECIFMIEELAGHDLDNGAIASVLTVSDLYGLYAQEESRVTPGAP